MTVRLHSLPLSVACAVLAFAGPVASAAPKHDLPVRTPCPVGGSVYLPREYDLSGQYGYRLIVYEREDRTNDMTVDADWTVETFDRRSGKVLSELLLEWSCPVGWGNCQVFPRLPTEKTAYQAIDEVPMNRDFTPASEPKSYAIVIPGLVDWRSGYVAGLEKYGDLRFFTKAEAVPDLSGALIWVRASCWGRSSAR